MRTTTCPKCDKNAEVVHYVRDDPVLSCGHTLTLVDQLERDKTKDGVYEVIRDEVYGIMRNQGIPYRQAVKVFWESNE